MPAIFDFSDTTEVRAIWFVTQLKQIAVMLDTLLKGRRK